MFFISTFLSACSCIGPYTQGVYLFGDFYTGATWGLPSPRQGAPLVLLFTTGSKIGAFGQDEGSELYLANYSGTLYQLEKKNINRRTPKGHLSSNMYSLSPDLMMPVTGNFPSLKVKYGE